MAYGDHLWDIPESAVFMHMGILFLLRKASHIVSGTLLWCDAESGKLCTAAPNQFSQGIVVKNVQRPLFFRQHQLW